MIENGPVLVIGPIPSQAETRRARHHRRQQPAYELCPANRL